MIYTEAYNYLISLANLPRREYMKDSKHCEIYLKRLGFLLKLMGSPEKKIKHYIHITGTSGKGSVALMTSKILHQAKNNVGTITSPHPSTITERWEINGKSISKKKFVYLIEKMKPVLDEYLLKSPYDMPSFFEIITAIGLYYFAQEKVDWAVVEVGLGGRYDSTNVIPNKNICVITNIGDDHKNIIGPTKKDIAYEKCGIIKKGCTVFTMEKDKDLLNIFKTEFNQVKGKHFNVLDEKSKIVRQNISGTEFKYKDNTYTLGVLGKHQVKNAIIAIEIASSLKIKQVAINKALSQVRLPIKMETVTQNPTIILDGAHNKDKVSSTINTVRSIDELKNKNLHLIVGFSDDKEWSKMLDLLFKLKPKSIACTRYTNNAFRVVATPKEIYKIVKEKSRSTKCKMFLDPIDAYKWSRKQARKKDLILVTGSIFLSGEIRPLIIK